MALDEGAKTLTASFQLPAGAYATTMLGELFGALDVVHENRGKHAAGDDAPAQGLIGALGIGKGGRRGGGKKGAATKPLHHLDGWLSGLSGFGRNPIYPGLAGRGHRATVEWLVRGSGDITIRWVAGRGGSGEQTVSV